jgi:hypothetical protein
MSTTYGHRLRTTTVRSCTATVEDPEPPEEE